VFGGRPVFVARGDEGKTSRGKGLGANLGRWGSAEGYQGCLERTIPSGDAKEKQLPMILDHTGARLPLINRGESGRGSKDKGGIYRAPRRAVGIMQKARNNREIRGTKASRGSGKKKGTTSSGKGSTGLSYSSRADLGSITGTKRRAKAS